MLFRFHVGNLGEDGVDIDAAAALGPFEQLALGVERGELFGEGAADELIDGNRKAPCNCCSPRIPRTTRVSSCASSRAAATPSPTYERVSGVSLCLSGITGGSNNRH